MRKGKSKTDNRWAGSVFTGSDNVSTQRDESVNCELDGIMDSEITVLFGTLLMFVFVWILIF